MISISVVSSTSYLITSKKKDDFFLDEISKLIKSVFSSPLFFSFCLFLGLVFSSFSVFVISLKSVYIALFCLSSLGLIIKNFPKKILFELSMADALVRSMLNPKKNSWWKEIEKNIYLGALPLKKHETELFENLKIDAILSVLEEEEMRFSTFFVSSYDTKKLRKLNINHKLISTEDLRPISLEQLNEAADFIYEVVSNNKKIYIHCKAGKSRSVLSLCSYYIKYKNMTVLEAFNKIARKRSSVFLFKSQFKCIQDYYYFIKKQQRSAI
jgi:atypical dual specificity phosphatase